MRKRYRALLRSLLSLVSLKSQFSYCSVLYRSKLFRLPDGFSENLQLIQFKLFLADCTACTLQRCIKKQRTERFSVKKHVVEGTKMPSYFAGYFHKQNGLKFIYCFNWPTRCLYLRTDERVYLRATFLFSYSCCNTVYMACRQSHAVVMLSDLKINWFHSIHRGFSQFNQFLFPWPGYRSGFFCILWQICFEMHILYINIDNADTADLSIILINNFVSDCLVAIGKLNNFLLFILLPYFCISAMTVN